MSPRIPLLGACAALVAAALPAPAAAAPRGAVTPAARAVAPVPAGRRVVGILDVRASGGATDVGAELEQSLEQQLDTSSYWLASRAAMRERMRFSPRWVEGCVTGPCLAEIRTQTGAELVVLAVLDGAGTSFGYAITVLRTDTGRVVAQETVRCDVCTVKETVTEATLATIRLLNTVPDQLPDEAAQRGAEIDLSVGKLARRLASREAAWRRRGVRLAIAGLAVAAVGIGLYVAQDDAEWPLLVTAAGGGLGMGGVVALTF